MNGSEKFRSVQPNFLEDRTVYSHRYIDGSNQLPSYYHNPQPASAYSSSPSIRGFSPSSSLPWNYDEQVNPSFSANPERYQSFSTFSNFSPFSPSYSYSSFRPQPSGSINNYYSSFHSPNQPSYVSNLSASSRSFHRHPRNDSRNVVNIDKVKSGEDKRTTLMIRNIPNGYTREAVMNILNMKCKNMYDFFYLPMDQNTQCNMGYGYVNMTDLNGVIVIYENYNNCKWPHTKSEKVCSICYGRLQSGKEDLLNYCSDWSIMTSEEKYHPLFFKPKVITVDGEERTEMVQYKPRIDLSMRKF